MQFHDVGSAGGRLRETQPTKRKREATSKLIGGDCVCGAVVEVVDAQRCSLGLCHSWVVPNRQEVARAGYVMG